MKRLAGVVAVCAIVGTVGCGRAFVGGGGGGGATKYHKADYHLAILLIDGGGGVCKTQTVPPTFPAAKGDTLTWDVVNVSCSGTPGTPTLEGFKGENSGNGDPTDPDPSTPLKRKVKGNAPYDTYKYTVRLGSQVEDPEIEINQ